VAAGPRAQGRPGAIRGLTEEADVALERGVYLAREVDNRGTRPSSAPCGPTTPCSSTPAGPRRRPLGAAGLRGDRRHLVRHHCPPVRAEAALESGEVEAARLLAEGLLDQLTNPVERGRCLIVVSRAHLKAGDLDEAAYRADQAIRSLETTGPPTCS
jgi:hypothetical protein